MPRAKTLGLLLPTLLAASALAADPAWYIKKPRPQATLEASRQAFAEREPRPAAAAPLPDLGRDAWSVLVWLRTPRGGTVVAKAPATGGWAPQGKTLFIRDGRLTYDVGWVGAVQGKARVADGQWHHVAATCHDRIVRLYVDGQPDAGGALDSEADVPGHVLKIGFTCPDFPRGRSAFLGELDELRLYPRALPPEAIRAHAAKSPPEKAPGPLAAWPFEKSLADATGHGHDAAPAGSPAFVDGVAGQALKLDGKTHAVVGTAQAGSFLDQAWPLLQRDFPKHVHTLFDGASLKGWHRRNRPGHGWGAVWDVDDGAITGVQEWPGSWGMLATRQAFGDFELHLEVRTDWPLDAGVLLRENRGGHAYEVTLHTRDDGDVGGLATHWLPDAVRRPAKGWAKLWKRDEWNRLRIAIQGNPPTLRTWLNGQPLLTWKDEAAEPRLPPRGPLGLKVTGPEATFNNRLRVRRVRLIEYP